MLSMRTTMVVKNGVTLLVNIFHILLLQSIRFTTVDATQYEYICTKLVLSYEECNDPDFLETRDGCFWLPLFDQYKSCFGICHGQYINERSCEGYCPGYLAESCDRVLITTPGSGTTSPTSSAPGSTIIIATVIPCVVVLIILIVYLLLELRRKCKGNHCWCRSSQYFRYCPLCFLARCDRFTTTTDGDQAGNDADVENGMADLNQGDRDNADGADELFVEVLPQEAAEND